MVTSITEKVSDLSENDVDIDIGQKVLEEWEDEARWLPDGFSDEASVESAELIACQRKIEREIIASEHTEELELSQSAYRNKKNKLHSESEYQDRENDIPQGGKWEGGTLAYKVPDTHRETNCSECSGSGRLSCRNCGSSGSVHCPNCSGTARQETERTCPRCSGSGWYNEESELQCGQCAGKGYEIIDEKCMQCRGNGDISCPECSGSGELTCSTCDGEGLTHKLKVLYRECEPQKRVEHTTHGIREGFVSDADGKHVHTKEGDTGPNRPRHEIETRRIDVLKVDYTYEDQPLIGDGGEEKDYSVHLVEGDFKKGDYPKNSKRKVLPIVGLVSLVVLVAVVYFIFAV